MMKIQQLFFVGDKINIEMYLNKETKVHTLAQSRGFRIAFIKI